MEKLVNPTIIGVLLIATVVCQFPKCPPITLQLCSFGRVYSEDGCRTSQCQPSRCPEITRHRCAGGFREIDVNGCQTSRCKYSHEASDVATYVSEKDDQFHSCPPITLQLCEFGRVYNEDGCETSQCQESRCPGITRQQCPGGFREIDRDGCQTSTCMFSYARRPSCPPVTDQFCYFGRVYDVSGCMTNQCQMQKPCPPIRYQLCPGGLRLIDENGCQMSQCKYN